MYVYFVQAGGIAGPVKIGIAADPESRLVDMQIGNHEALVLLAAVPGSAPREKDLHRRFAAGRVRGEWFAWDTPGLAQEIAHAIDEEIAFEYADRLCAHCRVRAVEPPRTKVCSEACYQARKRAVTTDWKASRK